MEGLGLNTRVGIQYLAAWLTGSGAVPLYNLMEDAATAEIRNGDGLGVEVTPKLFTRVVEEEMDRIQKEIGSEKFKSEKYKEGCTIFTDQCTATELDEFLSYNTQSPGRRGFKPELPDSHLPPANLDWVRDNRFAFRQRTDSMWFPSKCALIIFSIQFFFSIRKKTGNLYPQRTKKQPTREPEPIPCTKANREAAISSVV